MSGIVGIYYLDGQPVNAANLRKMVDILAHRGPDGADLWYRGFVGLGHRMLWATPESLNEKLPLANASGDLVITADARIDNRDELISILDFGGRPTGETSDGQLILAAYEKWGQRCPEKLLGDFAFAIWDGGKQELFCARDHFGVKPFYYYLSDTIFIFASEIKAIFCWPEVSRQINELKIAEYLTATFDDVTNTFYQDIQRLSPAHSITISPARKQLQTYWSLDPTQELQMASDSAYAEMFREVFFKAVRCRLRSAFPVGSMLSGGLDSSSITCVAQELSAQNGEKKFKTFSNIFDQVPQSDERRYIDAVLAEHQLEPHYIHGDQCSPLTDLERMFWHQDEAFFAYNLALHSGLYRTANKQGVRILLDGFDGDTTVSHGAGYLRELAMAGRWFRLANEMKGLAKTYNQSPHKLFWEYMWRFRFYPIISNSPGLNLGWRLWRAVVRQRRRFRRSYNGASSSGDILNPEFARRISLEKRRQKPPAQGGSERENHYRLLTRGVMPFTLEILDKAAAPFSIEPRYPFWDKRLVEFCLALPPDQKLHQGWSRMVLRRAMEGILPQEIQWRDNKSNLGPGFIHTLRTFESEHLGEVIHSNLSHLDKYVNTPIIHAAYARFLSQTSTDGDVEAIWKASTLALWLDYVGISNGVYCNERRFLYAKEKKVEYP